MFNRGFALCAALAGLAALISSSPSVHAGTAAPAASEPQLIDDASLSAKSVTMGGADVLPTTRTIPHWWGSAVDPNNGLTYGYNMVGANPNTCAGAACSVTIEADITPIVVHVAGRTYDGHNVLAATLASPQFEGNDYGSTTVCDGRRTEYSARARRGPVPGRRRGASATRGCDNAGAVQQDGSERVSPDPAPERPAAGRHRRAFEPGHTASVRPWRRVCGHQHQLVELADSEPDHQGRSDTPRDLFDRRCPVV